MNRTHIVVNTIRDAVCRPSPLRSSQTTAGFRAMAKNTDSTTHSRTWWIVWKMLAARNATKTTATTRTTVRVETVSLDALLRLIFGLHFG